MKHSYTGIIVGGSALLVLGVAFYGVAGYITFNHQHVVDQVTVWKYQPSAAVSEQISRTKMTDDGKFLYLASRPTVESKADFDATCRSVTSDTTILGCYTQPAKRIYLYHVTDAHLDGTEEVMAAHEMLRAAWDRTTAADKARLKPELDRVLAANTDADLGLKTRMTNIEINDLPDRDAELYAILGTEVPDVGATLEKNYAQYLGDRGTVTALNAHARAYTIALNKKVAALRATLTGLDSTLDRRTKSFDHGVSALSSDIKTFNSRAETPGGFSSEAAFEQARAALVNRQNSLRSTAKSINKQVDAYNADLAKLKTLDEKAASLFQNLNSTLPELPNLNTA